MDGGADHSPHARQALRVRHILPPFHPPPGREGGWLASLKVAIYPATPALLFGWLLYSDFIFGLWVGFFLVPAFHYLHDVSWGRSVAYVTVLIGVQILYVVLTGEGWLLEP